VAKRELTDLVKKLDELCGKNGVPQQIELLREDATKHYLQKYDSLGSLYRTAWDEVITRRLSGMDLAGPFATDISTLKFSWKSQAKSTGLKIHFGQMRVGPDFQGSKTTDQVAVMGFPDDLIIGKSIRVVSGSITGGNIRPDHVPVQIFYSVEHERWVAANNRGYTAHCRAGVAPLRIWPREATQDELNRLKETEGGTAGDKRLGPFTYTSGVAHLNAHPRTLPSLEMPITNGPNTWEVIEVVQVPSTFS